MRNKANQPRRALTRQSTPNGDDVTADELLTLLRVRILNLETRLKLLEMRLTLGMPPTPTTARAALPHDVMRAHTLAHRG